MTEQELRALVREAIARSGTGAGRSDRLRQGYGESRRSAAVSDGAEAEDRQLRTAGPAGTGLPFAPGHSSHAMFTLAPGDPEGRCMIEPGVACNHCGYCKSYGH